MAALSDSDRAGLLKAFGADVSQARTALNLSRAELRAAINSIDDWIDSNAASFNAAIPQPARGALTGQQKADLLLRVVRRRFEVT